MSRATLFAFQADGLTKVVGARKVVDLHNAWRFAPSVWDALCARYFPSEGVMTKWNKLFAMQDQHEKLEWFERVAYHSTCDRALVRAADVESLERAYRDFEKRYPVSPGCLDRHLLPIITHMRIWLQEFPGAIAFGFQATSVSENLWVVREPCPCCGGDEHADSRDYDLNRDTGHFFVEMSR